MALGPGGEVIGYCSGQVHDDDDGEGIIDFVAVDEAARGRGTGRLLTTALTRELLDRSSQRCVALVVQDKRALYAALGFRTDMSLVAYRG